MTADGQQLVCMAVAPGRSCGWLGWGLAGGSVCVQLSLFRVLPNSPGWISLGHSSVLCLVRTRSSQHQGRGKEKEPRDGGREERRAAETTPKAESE